MSKSKKRADDGEVNLTMKEKKEVVGYYAEDGNIYCVESIYKNREIMEILDKA